ncbi:glycine-rich cell wall structural protein-like [Lycium ferocissimum]|uniref:glycine-rich cell wall structural protein-like n=1 Tax=Lycium ferocissimum TaxID=112874 RepID=UPI0028167194|nr:glycine-rich cell wall structural protein-like [Lycium ferocissimum]
MARFLISSLDVDDSSSKAGAMISYSEGLFLLCVIIFSVLVVSVVVFVCTDHPEKDTVSMKKKKNKPKSVGTCASNIGGAGSMIMYSGAGGGGGACCGGSGGGGGCGGGGCGGGGGC